MIRLKNVLLRSSRRSASVGILCVRRTSSYGMIPKTQIVARVSLRQLNLFGSWCTQVRRLRPAVRGSAETRGGRAGHAELHTVWQSLVTVTDQVLLVTAKSHSWVPRRHTPDQQHRIPRRLPLPRQTSVSFSANSYF